MTAAAKVALVHGDVSPKNILVGPEGPMFLDAECAWYGDPAFDLAFCLNHLLLKCLAVPAATDGFLGSFDALAESYLGGIAWESPAALEARAAHLLPGLLLGRVDGKSPVEYLTAEDDKECVRQVARRLLTLPRSPRRGPRGVARATRQRECFRLSDTTILTVHGRRVWDSRGRPTVEAEVGLAGGGRGRAIAPAGASTGSGEALDRRDGGAVLGGFDVQGAVAAVNDEIAPALAGLDAADQAAVDLA